MPRDLDDLAASVGRTVAALREAQQVGVRKAAIHTAQMIRPEIRKVTGDMRLSGVGKSGANVGVEALPSRLSTPTNPAWLVKSKGPLWLIERDTDPHPIYPKGMTYSTTRRGNLRRRGKTKALKIGDRFAAYADHPGTSGQRPFAKGVDKARPDTPRIFQQEVRKAVVKAWGA